jgi:hypothetical protein
LEVDIGNLVGRFTINIHTETKTRITVVYNINLCTCASIKKFSSTRI